MVMQRRAHFGEYLDVQEAQQRHLHKPDASVHHQYKCRQQVQERIARFHDGNRDKKSHCTRAGIAHQKAARRRIKPQIAKDTGDKQ